MTEKITETYWVGRDNDGEIRLYSEKPEWLSNKYFPEDSMWDGKEFYLHNPIPLKGGELKQVRVTFEVEEAK